MINSFHPTSGKFSVRLVFGVLAIAFVLTHDFANALEPAKVTWGKTLEIDL